MIAFLKGTIEDITENSLVLDVNGRLVTGNPYT